MTNSTARPNRPKGMIIPRSNIPKERPCREEEIDLWRELRKGSTDEGREGREGTQYRKRIGYWDSERMGLGEGMEGRTGRGVYRIAREGRESEDQHDKAAN